MVIDSPANVWSSMLEGLAVSGHSLLRRLQILDAFVLNHNECFNLAARRTDSNVTLNNNDQTENRKFAIIRPRLLSDLALKGAVRLLIKKFPNLPEPHRVDGAFIDQKNSLFEELLIYYDMFKEIQVFCWEAAAALKQSIFLDHLNWDVTPTLCHNFLEVFVIRCMILAALANLPIEKQALVAGYAMAHQLIIGISEPNFCLLADFLHTTRNSQNDLIMISPKISSLLVNFELLNDLSVFMTVGQLRASKLVSMSHNLNQDEIEEENSVIPATDDWNFQKAACLKLSFGILVTTGEAAVSEKCIRLFKRYSKNVSVWAVTQNQSIDFTAAFSSTNPTLHGKLENTNIYESAIFHSQRRDYLIQELEVTINLFNQPNTLSDKINTVAICLGFARDEVHWYFSSYKSVGPDDKIFQLMWLTSHLRSLLLEHQEIIQHGILSTIQHTDISATLLFMENYMDITGSFNESTALYEQLICHVNEIMETSMQTIRPENFKEFRITWNQFQTVAILHDSHFPEDILRQIQPVMDRLAHLTVWIDGFPVIVEKYGSFEELAFFLDHILNKLQKAIDSTNNIHEFYGSCIWIVKDFLKLMDHLEGQNATHSALSVFVEQYISSAFDSISRVTAQNMIDLAISKPFKPEHIKTFRKEAVHGLLSTAMIPSFFLQNEYCLLQAILHELQILFDKYMNNSEQQTLEEPIKRLEDSVAVGIKRPTDVLQCVKGIIEVAKLADSITSFGFVQAILDQLKANIENANTQGLIQNVLGAYFVFYRDFVCHQLSNGLHFFSQQRQSFLSQYGTHIEAEKMTHPEGIRALCKMLGPQGTKFYVECLIDIQMNILERIQGFMMHNKDLLVTLRTNNDCRGLEVFQKLKGLKDVAASLIEFAAVDNFLYLLEQGFLQAFLAPITGRKVYEVIDTLFPKKRRISQILQKQADCLDLFPIFVVAVFVHLSKEPTSIFNSQFGGLENNSHLLIQSLSSNSSLFHLAVRAFDSNKTVYVMQSEFCCLSQLWVGRLKMSLHNQPNKKNLLHNVDSVIWILREVGILVFTVFFNNANRSQQSSNLLAHMLPGR
ncbi:membrane-associated apoptosis protein-domain-containing protein [Chytriomyces sp. MP71]|nr:membrane-associated apoptosis protein-domain-containing protein [Chytriomyces sp. MP71]